MFDAGEKRFSSVVVYAKTREQKVQQWDRVVYISIKTLGGISVQVLEARAPFASLWGPKVMFRRYLLAHRANGVEASDKCTIPR